MPDMSVPVLLIMRNDGQLQNESGTIVYASVAAVREAYDIPAGELPSWPVGHALRFPR